MIYEFRDYAKLFSTAIAFLTLKYFNVKHVICLIKLFDKYDLQTSSNRQYTWLNLLDQTELCLFKHQTMSNRQYT